MVEGNTQEFPATVIVVEEQRHSLVNGDEVVFCGIKDMEELSRDAPYLVTVTGVHSFTIQEDTRLQHSRHIRDRLQNSYTHRP